MNENVSRMIKAMDGWTESLKSYSQPPKGMFGRVAIIESGGVKIDSRTLDVEFNVPFDDDLESNEAEIIIYNLSKTTRQALKAKNQITITAGYGEDTGIIFDGKIAKVKTTNEQTDEKTVIKAYDYIGGAEEELKDKTYKKGTKASYILKDLLGYLDPPIAVFSTPRDHTYKDEVKISGSIWEEIKKYAEVCKVSAYINKGMIYVRPLSEGENVNFIISADTGLIGSPEEFSEEVTAEDYTDIITGYKLKMLLQHRMNTAAIADLKTVNVTGQFRVRKGKHIFNNSESTTEIEVVANG